MVLHNREKMVSLVIQDRRVLQEWRCAYDYLFIYLFCSSCIDIYVYHALTKGEPGMGEKGERGLDGFPGMKVKYKGQILNRISLAA